MLLEALSPVAPLSSSPGERLLAEAMASKGPMLAEVVVDWAIPQLYNKK